MRQLISQKEEGSSVKQDVQPSKNVNQQDVATQSNERENNDIKGEGQTSKTSNQHIQSSNSHNQSTGTKRQLLRRNRPTISEITKAV